MILVYGFTVYLAFTGEIPISSMVMCISAATGMVTASTAITQSVIDLKRVCQYSAPFFELCHLPPVKPEGKEKVPHGSVWEIEFQNVSFAYPHTEEKILKNISVKITSGQKLSIVGLNGAGKTTFVKLLLRLYDPDEGRILLNGKDIGAFDYGEYTDLFSVVFQDFQLFSGSIAENIAVADEYEEEKIEQALKKVNLSDFVNQLEEKSETQLLRIFDEKGIELSGGQAGRVAIARAVYKDAPFVVLDEPTAALDPIAEYEIYKNFNDLVRGKTTIYISHRLSSCRFCDAVAVFENGRITEYGSHDKLLENRDGLYSEMWHAQSRYYV